MWFLTVPSSIASLMIASHIILPLPNYEILELPLALQPSNLEVNRMITLVNDALIHHMKIPTSVNTIIVIRSQLWLDLMIN